MLPFWRDQPGGTVQVMRVSYHKLVRDQIPATNAADGDQPVTPVLDQAGYEAALRRSCRRRRMKGIDFRGPAA